MSWTARIVDNPALALLPFLAAVGLLTVILLLLRRNERIRALRFPWYIGWPLALAVLTAGIYTVASLINFRRLFATRGGPGGGWHRALVETLDEIGPFRIAAALAGPGLLILLWGLYAGWLRAARFPRRMCPACRYDMTALPKALQCPECGRTAKRERDLFPFRRSRRLAIVGVLLILIGGGLGYFTFRFTASGGQLPAFVVVRMFTMADSPGPDTLDLLGDRIATKGGLSTSQRKAVLERLATIPMPTAAALLTAFTLHYPTDPDVLAASATLDQRITSGLSSSLPLQLGEAASALAQQNLTPAQLAAIFKLTGADANPAARPYLTGIALSSLTRVPAAVDANLTAPTDPVFAQAALQYCSWHYALPTAAQLKTLLALNDPAVTSTARIWVFTLDATEVNLDAILADPGSQQFLSLLPVLFTSTSALKTDQDIEHFLTMLDRRYPALPADQRHAIIAGIPNAFYARPHLINPHLRRWHKPKPTPHSAPGSKTFRPDP